MIEFLKEDTTFSNEEIDACNEQVDSIFHSLKITTPLPGDGFCGSVTAEWGMGATPPPGMDPTKFQTWIRMEVKRKIQWLHAKHSKGKV